MEILKDIVDSKHYIFCEGFSDWTEAIKAAAAPLLAEGIIENTYVDAIIENVKEYGPYIIIAPEVAMPHSTLGGSGVHDTCISFMKTEKPVVFDPNDPTKGGVTPTPVIPGYVTDIPNVTPSNPGADTPVVYRKADQKAVITYVDQTTGQTLANDQVGGKSGEAINYSTVDKIKYYEDRG
ncbi:PTS sugar transporter subunit IIA, partial [Holdemania filiformis]|uniref:PTS sugar transporter subunit IIA n=1 Tax=Holdemania filiformis TaxID=61171 RepID=UPI002431E442